METLNVYLLGNRVGALVSDLGRLKFRYDAAYLSQPEAQPLSYTMPLRTDPYSGGEVVSFFSNLLPDESVRVRLAQYLGISPGNIEAHG